MEHFKEAFTLKNFIVSMLGMATVFFFGCEGEIILLPQLISLGLGVLTYGAYKWFPEKKKRTHRNQKNHSTYTKR